MITSNSNPKVKKLLTWQKKRKEREEDGIYIVEGLRMFVEAPQDKVREVYVSESFYKKKREEKRCSRKRWFVNIRLSFLWHLYY